MPCSLKNMYRSLQTHPIIWLCRILFSLMLGIYFLRFFVPEAAQEVETALCLGGFGYSLLHRPWSLLTYFWLHNNMWHLNLNLLLLIFYGRVYLSHESTSRFFALFLGGGIFGGLGYIAGAWFLTSLGVNVLRMPLSGASGSVVALMVATLLLYPRQRFRVKRCSFPLYLLSILFFYSDCFDFGTKQHWRAFGSLGRSCLWSSFFSLASDGAKGKRTKGIASQPQLSRSISSKGFAQGHFFGL